MVLALRLLAPGTASASGCDQALFEFASHVRRMSQESKKAFTDDSCKASSEQFIQAVTARKAASACQEGATRRRIIEILDVEIEKFNDEFAAQSGGG
jgi:hypothetical protein